MKSHPSAKSSASSKPAVPAQEPALEAPKPVSVHRSYLNRVAAIFAGHRSKPEELFEPMMRMNIDDFYFVGIVSDPMAREFFSLQYRLKEEALHLPFPRNADQVRAHSALCKEVELLSVHASELGWQIVRDLFPNKVNLEHDDLQIIEGWKVVRKKTSEDDLRETLSRRGSPADLIDHEVRALRRREDLQRDSSRRAGGGRDFLRSLLSGLDRE